MIFAATRRVLRRYGGFEDHSRAYLWHDFFFRNSDILLVGLVPRILLRSILRFEATIWDHFIWWLTHRNTHI